MVRTLRAARIPRYSTASESVAVSPSAQVHSLLSLSYMCDEPTACFTSITQEQLLGPQNLPPPDNCPPCLLLSQQDQDRMITPIKDGIVYLGHNFHKYDFVLCHNAGAGPAHIAQLLRFISTRGRNSAPDSVVVRVLGRIGDIIDICPENIIKDEVRLRRVTVSRESQVWFAAPPLRHRRNGDHPDPRPHRTVLCRDRSFL